MKRHWLLPPEVTMTKTSTNRPSSSPTDSQRDALARLQRIYGRRSVAPDLFGRRPALPNEIERLAKGEQQPQSLPAQPRKTMRQRPEKCG
jgi:hypothetical protein